MCKRPEPDSNINSFAFEKKKRGFRRAANWGVILLLSDLIDASKGRKMAHNGIPCPQLLPYPCSLADFLA